MRREDREWARRMYRNFYAPHASDEGFKAWLEYVLEIEVELHPGCRATLQVPDSHMPVELRWDPDTSRVTSFYITTDDGGPLFWHEIAMSHYFAALGLALSAIDVPGGGAAPPARGRPPSLAFYRQIDAEYQQLLAEGHRAPIAELARRYGSKPETVKSWRRRGRIYMDKANQDAASKAKEKRDERENEA